MIAHHTPNDRYIPYGRGGAGNMRRRSSIRDAWFKISTSPSASPLTLISSPSEHYASSKTEPRRRSTHSSLWSASTAGREEKRGGWKRWLGFGRRGSESESETRGEEKIEENTEEKIEEKMEE